MQRSFIVSLVLSILLVIFVLQNTQDVAIKLFFWQVEGPLVLILIIVAFLGAITSTFLSLSSFSKLKKEIKTRDKKIKVLLEKKEAPKPPVSPPSQP